MKGFKLVGNTTEVNVCKTKCVLYIHSNGACPERARELCEIADMESDINKWHYFVEVEDE